MVPCYLAFGGNQNDVQQTFDHAWALLSTHAEITPGRMSKLYRTAPVGENAGDTFLNAACALQTSLDPLALLDVVQQIELQLGRRREQHWGPRTIDIDIILYDQMCVDQPRLRIPHPACWYRRFVLDPLGEIAGEVMHSVKQVTIQELQTRLLKRPFTVALAGAEPHLFKSLTERLSGQFPEIIFSHWNSTAEESQPEPTLLVWLGQSDKALLAKQNLPALPFLDLSQADNTVTALRDVLQSAWG